VGDIENTLSKDILSQFT